jgi:L-asparaginase
MKKILMIGTGGTIASQKSENGLKPGLDTEEILTYIPNVKEICDIDTYQLSNIDSSNITPKHWLSLAKTVEENYNKYDGFVICHGTDTLAYTAAALSYLIQNSTKPIVITGAQKPISKDVTDAKTNLYDSFLYASDEDSHGVNIVFDGKVILGTRAKKERTKSYNAFSSINYPYPAIIRDGHIIRYIYEKPYTEKVIFYQDLYENICILKLFPGISSEIFAYMFERYDCIIIESFGVGGLPDYLANELYHQMKTYAGKEKIFVMATQVVSEGSDMEIYEVGKRAKFDFDFLETYDMTLESTVTKLMYILAQPDFKFSNVKDMFYKEIAHDIMK